MLLFHIFVFHDSTTPSTFRNTKTPASHTIWMMISWLELIKLLLHLFNSLILARMVMLSLECQVSLIHQLQTSNPSHVAAYIKFHLPRHNEIQHVQMHRLVAAVLTVLVSFHHLRNHLEHAHHLVPIRSKLFMGLHELIPILWN